MANPLRKQGGVSEETFRAQSNLENVLKGLDGATILNGVFLENISVSTATTSVEHKLNRAYRGYIVCSNDTYCDIKIVPSSNTKLFLNLQASAPCVISLWVF